MFASLRGFESIRGARIMTFLIDRLRAVGNRVGRGAMPEYVNLKEVIHQELQLAGGVSGFLLYFAEG